MKKLLAILLTLAMLLSLSACMLDGTEGKTTDGKTNGTTAANVNINTGNFATHAKKTFGIDISVANGWSVKSVHATADGKSLDVTLKYPSNADLNLVVESYFDKTVALSPKGVYASVLKPSTQAVIKGRLYTDFDALLDAEATDSESSSTVAWIYDLSDASVLFTVLATPSELTLTFSKMSLLPDPNTGTTTPTPIWTYEESFEDSNGSFTTVLEFFADGSVDGTLYRVHADGSKTVEDTQQAEWVKSGEIITVTVNGEAGMKLRLKSDGTLTSEMGSEEPPATAPSIKPPYSTEVKPPFSDSITDPIIPPIVTVPPFIGGEDEIAFFGEGSYVDSKGVTVNIDVRFYANGECRIVKSSFSTDQAHSILFQSTWEKQEDCIVIRQTVDGEYRFAIGDGSLAGEYLPLIYVENGELIDSPSDPTYKVYTYENSFMLGLGSIQMILYSDGSVYTEITYPDGKETVKITDSEGHWKNNGDSIYVDTPHGSYLLSDNGDGTLSKKEEDTSPDWTTDIPVNPPIDEPADTAYSYAGKVRTDIDGDRILETVTMEIDFYHDGSFFGIHSWTTADGGADHVEEVSGHWQVRDGYVFLNGSSSSSFRVKEDKLVYDTSYSPKPNPEDPSGSVSTETKPPRPNTTEPGTSYPIEPDTSVDEQPTEPGTSYPIEPDTSIDEQPTEPPAVCAHSYDKGTVLQEPTCGKEGLRKISCTKCGHSYTELIDKLKEHSKLEEIPLSDPTCSEEGVIRHRCIECGYSYTEKIPPLDYHEYDENYHCIWCGAKSPDAPLTPDECPHPSFVVVNEEKPTCVNQGYIEYFCHDCGFSFYEWIPATGIHENYSVTAEQHPTCGMGGWIQYSCDVCGDSYTEERPATDKHPDYKTATVQEPTCMQEGILEHVCVECGYSYTENIPPLDYHEYDENYHCIWCGAKSPDAPLTPDECPHPSFVVVNEEKPTCVSQGYIEHFCYDCGFSFYEWIPATGIHENYSVTAKQHPTCGTGGWIQYSCDVCGDSYTEELPATDKHPDYKTATVQEPTCMQEGILEHVCVECGYSYTENIPPLDYHEYDENYHCIWCGAKSPDAPLTPDECSHPNPVVVNEEKPTCVSQGYIEHFCHDCGFSYYEWIPATGIHENYSVTAEQHPTCGTGGWIQYSCDVCGDSYTEELPATDKHPDYKTATVQEPTCMQEGILEHVCVECGYSYTENIPPLDYHEYDENYHCIWCGAKSPDAPLTPDECPHPNPVVVNEEKPTCGSFGYIETFCYDCGMTWYEELPMLPEHQNYYPVHTTPPSCIKIGETEYFCTDCGSTFYVTIPMLDTHEYMDGFCMWCGTADPDYVPEKIEFTVSLRENVTKALIGEFYYTEDTSKEEFMDLLNSCALPEIEGFVFVEWNFDYDEHFAYNSPENLTIWAFYEPIQSEEYRVAVYDNIYGKFIGEFYYSETTSTEEFYAMLNSIELPIFPGYIFSAWDFDFDKFFAENALRDIDLWAIYTSDDSTVPEGCKHENVTVNSETKPTCMNDGFVEYYCCDCGNLWSEYLPTEDHQYDSGTCVWCGAMDPTVEFECKHEFMANIHINATCQHGEYVEYNCPDCGYSNREFFSDAIDHVYNENGLCFWCGTFNPDAEVKPEEPAEPQELYYFAGDILFDYDMDGVKGTYYLNIHLKENLMYYGYSVLKDSTTAIEEPAIEGAWWYNESSRICIDTPYGIFCFVPRSEGDSQLDVYFENTSGSDAEIVYSLYHDVPFDYDGDGNHGMISQVYEFHADFTFFASSTIVDGDYKDEQIYNGTWYESDALIYVDASERPVFVIHADGSLSFYEETPDNSDDNAESGDVVVEDEKVEKEDSFIELPAGSLN